MTYPLNSLNLIAQPKQSLSTGTIGFTGGQRSSSSHFAGSASSGRENSKGHAYVGLAGNNANLQGVSSNHFGRQNISNTIGIG